MNRSRLFCAAAGAAAMVAAAVGLSPGAVAATAPGYHLANVGPYGGEPSLVSDAAGRLYVATTVGVQCFDPTGRLNGVLLNPTATPPTGVALGGPDHDLLYIACGDQLFVRKTRARAFLPPEKAAP